MSFFQALEFQIIKPEAYEKLMKTLYGKIVLFKGESYVNSFISESIVDPNIVSELKPINKLNIWLNKVPQITPQQYSKYSDSISNEFNSVLGQLGSGEIYHVTNI